MLKIKPKFKQFLLVPLAIDDQVKYMTYMLIKDDWSSPEWVLSEQTAITAIIKNGQHSNISVDTH